MIDEESIVVEKIWNQCLDCIRDNVSPQHYKTWFEPIAPLKFDETTKSLTVQVPSQFYYEFLEANFLPLIQATLHRVIGKNANLMYSIVTDKENSIDTKIPTGENRAMPALAPQIPSKTSAPQPRDLNPMLNPNYTFNNFIEGASNKLTRSVGEAVAESPAKNVFNPLFIYGPSGVGKTHLVNAIGTKIRDLYPNLRVLYVSAHLFQVQYTDSVRKNSTNDFINFYQSIDVLIIDDIQEFASLSKTQNTFFHIFNHLHQNNKQLIFTSDRSPAMLQGMEERLLTRFKWGLQAELEKPNYELRKDILKSKMRRDGLSFPEKVIDFIAENVNESVRDLEGVINSLMAYSIVYNHEVDIDMAVRVISKISKIEKKEITIDSILEKVCGHYEVGAESVHSKSRKKNVVQVRQIAMYLAKKYTNASLSKIGQTIGGRDHATVLHAFKIIQNQTDVDKIFREELQEIEESLKH